MYILVGHNTSLNVGGHCVTTTTELNELTLLVQTCVSNHVFLYLLESLGKAVSRFVT